MPPGRAPGLLARVAVVVVSFVFVYRCCAVAVLLLLTVGSGSGCFRLFVVVLGGVICSGVALFISVPGGFSGDGVNALKVPNLPK